MKTFEAISLITAEVHRASHLHPNWPQDTVYAAAIVCEESGELMRAAVQHERIGTLKSGEGSMDACDKEAIQTAASCIRFLTRGAKP